MSHMRPRIRSRPRRGFTLLEVEMAFIVLAIALAGLCPLLVMQSRQLSGLESQLAPQTTYYFAPSTDGWVQKLGASAALVTSDPGPAPRPPVTVVDNADPAYAETGSGWTSQSDPSAYQGSYRSHATGAGADTASWTFSGLLPGWYDVQVSWVAGSQNATNAPYTILDGTNPVGSFTANQTTTSGTPGQIAWNDLGDYLITGDVLVVQLSDAGNGFVVADAVTITPVRNTVQVNSLQRSLTADQLSVQVTVTPQVPQQ